MIETFRAKNFGCLADVSVPLTPIHVIIGRNDSGKTTLLEALHLLFSLISRDSPESLDGLDRSRVNFGSKSAEFELQAMFARAISDNYEYRAIASFDTPPRLREWVTSGDRTQDRSSPDGPRKRGFRFAEQEPDLFPLLRSCSGTVRFFHFRADMLKLSAALDQPTGSNLAEDGFGLPILLDHILNVEPETFLLIRHRFCEAFPQFSKISLVTEQGRVRRDGSFEGTQTGKALRFEVDGKLSITAQSVSDGAIIYLAFLALSHQPDPPSLLLIEEPELGIYPRILDEVVEMMKTFVERETNAPQIVFTTHSPYVLDRFTPDEVTFLQRISPTAVTARPMRDVPHIHERLGNGEFHLGELWYNLPEEELFADA